MAQDAFKISTPPNPTQCVPINFIWSGGQGPYKLSIFPSGQLNSQPLDNFTNIAGHTLQRRINVAGGTSVQAVLNDSNGIRAQSASFVVAPSNRTACLSGQAVQSLSSGASATAQSTNSPSPLSSSNTRSLSTGAIAGIAVTAAIVVCAGLALVWWLLRRRSRLDAHAGPSGHITQQFPLTVETTAQPGRAEKGAPQRSICQAEALPLSPGVDPYADSSNEGSMYIPCPTSPPARSAPTSKRTRGALKSPPSTTATHTTTRTSQSGSRPAPGQRRQEVDGGVRLAGGPMDETPALEEEHDEMSSVPPPYYRY